MYKANELMIAIEWLNSTPMGMFQDYRQYLIYETPKYAINLITQM